MMKRVNERGATRGDACLNAPAGSAVHTLPRSASPLTGRRSVSDPVGLFVVCLSGVCTVTIDLLDTCLAGVCTPAAASVVKRSYAPTGPCAARVIVVSSLVAARCTDS